jgi:polyisoprenoid-binding protein YceI
LNQVRVRAVEQPRNYLLLLLAAMTLIASAFVGAAATYAQEAEEPVASPAATETTADDDRIADGIDGTWTVDTKIGDFEDFSSSWVGFRVAEVLDRIGETAAVGRTPAVSGQLVVSGTTIESATIEADLTAIRSDQSRRDPAIQRALETGEFPVATFESNGAVDLGAVPAAGESFTASVPGIITVHGVSQDATLDMTGQRVGDVVVVVGTLPVDFTSFGITMPTAPVVVSVEDSGDLEWQLFFSREA